jgi:hypothetical protein
MTAMELAMSDETQNMGGRIGRVALIVGGGLGAIFGVGVIAGLLSANAERGGEIGIKLVGLLAAAALIAAGSAWVAWRAARAAARAGGAPTTREKRNRVVMAACMLLGGGIGVALMLGGNSPLDAFNSTPLPPLLALALVAPIAVLLPLLTYYWHRNAIDEQEEAAYRNGALYGAYTYFYVAPSWWLLWRGGFVPAPDGILLYFLIITVTGVVWLWSKYR